MYLNILGEIGVEIGGKASTIVDYVKSEYGAFEIPELPQGAVDIEIEFVDDRSSPDDSVHIRAPISYDNRGVFLHDPQYHVFRVDFAAARDGKWRATCDVDFNPHFFAIIMEYMTHFQLLRRGSVFCHSSAFRLNGQGVLCPAWRNVGKTNLLLQFLQNGAEYIADDWSVVQRDGRFRCLPKRLNLLYYNFDQFPEMLDEVPPDFAALVRFVSRAKRGEFDLNQETLQVMEGQARMRISPYELYDQVMDTTPKPIDHVLLLQRVADCDQPVQVEPIDHDMLVTSLASILEFEQSHFHLAYSVFRARTGIRVDFLEDARQACEAVMAEAFTNIGTPYRVTIPSQRGAREAYATIRQLLTGESEDGARDSDRPAANGLSTAA